MRHPWLSNAARRVVNSTCRRKGYVLRWTPPRALAAPSKLLEPSFSLVAAHLMLRRPRPYFLNIGANDGIFMDPLYPFVRDFGWSGTVVEPLPEAFAALKRNYAGFAGITFVEAAVGAKDGQATIFTVDGSTQDALGASAHSSFSREILLRGAEFRPEIATHITTREVRVLSCASLLDAVPSPTIDVLKVDAEGYDLGIVRGFDFSLSSPALVVAEHANLSRQDKIEMADILLDHGYRIWMTRLDMLGYREPR